MDVYDGMAAVGLALVAVGLGVMTGPAMAAVVTGAILLGLGVFLASRRGG